MSQVREAGTRPRAEAPNHGVGSFSAERPSQSAKADATLARIEAERARLGTRLLLSGVLLGAVAAEAYVLYALPDPAVRIGLGLLPIVPIMWASSRLGIVDRFARALDERRRARRYVQLRSRTAQLLEEIKRMNWLVVDIQRGFRDEAAGEAELEAIQKRIWEIVEGLPDVAGKEGPVGGGQF